MTRISLRALATASLIFAFLSFSELCSATPRIGPGITVRTAATLGNGGAYEIYSRRLANGKLVSFIGARQQSKNGVIRSVTIQSRLGRGWSLTTVGEAKVMKRPLSEGNCGGSASQADLQKIKSVTNPLSAKRPLYDRSLTGRSGSDPWGVPLRLFYSQAFIDGLEVHNITDHESFWRAKLLEVEIPFRMQVNTHLIPSFVVLPDNSPVFDSELSSPRIVALWLNITNVEPYRTQHPPEGIYGIVDIVQGVERGNSSPFLCVGDSDSGNPSRRTTGTFALNQTSTVNISLYRLRQQIAGAIGPDYETSDYIMGNGKIQNFSEDSVDVLNSNLYLSRCSNPSPGEIDVCCINHVTDAPPVPTATNTPVAGVFVASSSVNFEIRSKRLLVVRLVNTRTPLPRLKARVLTAGGKLIKEIRLSTQGTGSYRFSKNLARGKYYVRVWDTKKVGKSSAKVTIS